MANRWGNNGNSYRLFFGAPKSLQMVIAAMKLKDTLLLGRKVMTNLDSLLKSRNITLPTKLHLVKAMVFPVVIYGCESWTIKKAESQRIDAFELWLDKTLESLLDCEEIQPVHPKGNQSWIFSGRTDAETEDPTLWLPNVKSWLTGKDPNAGKDWRQEKKRTTEEEMVGWHHWFDEHEFEQAPRDGEGPGSLACCIHGVTKSQTWLTDWKITKNPLLWCGDFK